MNTIIIIPGSRSAYNDTVMSVSMVKVWTFRFNNSDSSLY